MGILTAPALVTDGGGGHQPLTQATREHHDQGSQTSQPGEEGTGGLAQGWPYIKMINQPPSA